MAVDKLVDSTQLDSDLTSVANAIRTKGGTSAQLAFPSDFVSAINAIPTGGGGVTLAPMDYPVTIKNVKSGATRACVYLEYVSTCICKLTTGNIASGNSNTKSSMLTDGTHFWVRVGNSGSMTYSEGDCEYVKTSAGDYMITIPTGYDGTGTFDFK